MFKNEHMFVGVERAITRIRSFKRGRGVHEKMGGQMTNITAQRWGQTA